MYNTDMLWRLRYSIKSLYRHIFTHRDHISPLVTIDIFSDALIYNLNQFRKITPHKNVVPTLKSNAYGHGISLIARELEKEDIPFFVVDSYFEAKMLRSDGIETPILIIGFSSLEMILKNKIKDISFTITNLDSLKELSEEINKKIKIHLKIDTGMHRQGLLLNEVDQAFNIIKNNSNIILEGICSHFSDSDGTNDDFTLSQIKTWNDLVERTKKIFPEIKYIHISNTYGHRYSDKINANTSRLGIGLYGLANIEGLDLKPVLEMKTIISGIKNIKIGDTVGYNNTFTAPHDMTIATIPLGYYEGLDRRLSNKGYVKVNGKFCKIVGRVSMNITTIDITEIKNIKIGDPVQVISNIPSDKNSIHSISEISDTIPYEAIISLPERLRRVVIR